MKIIYFLSRHEWFKIQKCPFFNVVNFQCHYIQCCIDSLSLIFNPGQIKGPTLHGRVKTWTVFNAATSQGFSLSSKYRGMNVCQCSLSLNEYDVIIIMVYSQSFKAQEQAAHSYSWSVSITGSSAAVCSPYSVFAPIFHIKTSSTTAGHVVVWALPCE